MAKYRKPEVARLTPSLIQVEVDLVMETGVSPPPSLGIRVIGVNMIHGVPGTELVFLIHLFF